MNLIVTLNFGSGRIVSLFSQKILSADYAEVFMEYSEVCFLLSEANYVVNGTWDDAKYKEGVKASMEKWGVESSKITAFVTALPAATEETVMTQKYIALYMNPNEAWTDVPPYRISFSTYKRWRKRYTYGRTSTR